MAEKRHPFDDPNLRIIDQTRQVFYKDDSIVEKDEIRNPIASLYLTAMRYAYALSIEQRREIDALKQELQNLKNVFSNLIARCDLSADGPEGADAIARLNAILKK